MVGLPSAGFVLPKKVVTVSALGSTKTGLTNGGADFGPDTTQGATGPGQYGGTPSASIGIQEALDYVGNLGGGTVYLIPNGIYDVSSISSTISFKSNVVLKSEMWGGQGNGPTLSQPVSYIKFIAGMGVIIDAITVPTNVAKASLYGVAVVGKTNSPYALIRRSGARMSSLVDCFALNQQPSGPAPATQVDGFSVTAEDNIASRCYFDGNPAIQIGVPNEAKKSNNCRWDNITAENSVTPVGGSGVISGTEGNTHAFENVYSRGGGWPVFGGPVGYKVYNSELYVTGGAVLDQVTSSYAEVVFENCVFTYGFINWLNGPLSFRRCRLSSSFGVVLQQAGPPPPPTHPVYPALPAATYLVSIWIHGSSAKGFIDRTSDFSGAPTNPGSILVGDNVPNGGTLFYEADNPFLSLDTNNATVNHFATVTGAGANGTVRPRGPMLSTPGIPVPPLTYTNSTNSRQVIYLDGGQAGLKIIGVDGTASRTFPNATLPLQAFLGPVILNPGETLSYTTAPGSWVVTELD